MLLVFVGSCAPGGRETDHEGDHVEESRREETGGFLALDPDSVARAGIEVEASRLIKVPDSIETTAIVSANQNRVVHIRPLSSGTVRRVFVQKGQRVARGDELVEYDSIRGGELLGELASLRAQFGRSIALRDRALKLWETGKELYEADAISARELDSRTAEYRSAQETAKSLRAEIDRTIGTLGRLGATEEQIERAGRGGDAAATVPTSWTTLRAPFSSTVIEFDVAEGELVSPERALLTLADLSSVWVLANVYEADLRAIAEGQQASVSTRAYPDRLFPARVTAIDEVVDERTRTVAVRCLTENPNGLLKLGMFASVQIAKGSTRPTVTVPVKAVQIMDGETVVFVRDGVRFERRVVEVGPEWQGKIVVKAGLVSGELVVTTGAFMLKSEFHREAIGGHDH